MLSESWAKEAAQLVYNSFMNQAYTNAELKILKMIVAGVGICEVLSLAMDQLLILRKLII